MGGFGQYVLDAQGEGILEPDRAAWARWFETADRSLARDTVGGAEVSTAFVGIDHRFGGAGPPLLWETRIFGGPRDGYQTRHATRAEALDGHRKAVELARSAAPGAAVTPGAGSASAEGA